MMSEDQRLLLLLPADHSDHLLSNADLRRMKEPRSDFSRLERLPITVVLDNVRQNYNIGAMFRLCDAMRCQSARKRDPGLDADHPENGVLIPRLFTLLAPIDNC